MTISVSKPSFTTLFWLIWQQCQFRLVNLPLGKHSVICVILFLHCFALRRKSLHAVWNPLNLGDEERKKGLLNFCSCKAKKVLGSFLCLTEVLKHLISFVQYTQALLCLSLVFPPCIICEKSQFTICWEMKNWQKLWSEQSTRTF